MTVDTLMGSLERLPWDKVPNPGSMVVWALLAVGTCFALAVVHDLVARKKRPRG